MTAIVRFALMLAVPLALTACGGDKKAKDQRTATGEILPGSISDAMLPYDKVRSQPPLAPKESGKPGAAKDAARKQEGPGAAPVDPVDLEPAVPAEAPAPVAPPPE